MGSNEHGACSRRLLDGSHGKDLHYLLQTAVFSNILPSSASLDSIHQTRSTFWNPHFNPFHTRLLKGEMPTVLPGVDLMTHDMAPLVPLATQNSLKE